MIRKGFFDGDHALKITGIVSVCLILAGALAAAWGQFVPT